MLTLLLEKTRVKSLFKSLSLSFIKKEGIKTLCSSAIIWQILFFYFPLLFLFLRSFSSLDGESLTLSYFKEILTAPYFKVLFNSLGLAFITAVASLSIAIPLMVFIVFKTNKWKYPLLFLLIIPFWTNFILNIYAWFFILEKNGLLNQFLLYLGIIDRPIHFLYNPFSTLILMVYYYLPFVALPLFSALERFDLTLYEVSLTLGAGKYKTLSRIVFPMIEKAIIVGFFLVFVPAFGEFLVPEFMGGDKIYYVGNVISLYLLGGATAGVGIAFATFSIAFLLIASSCIFLIFRLLFQMLQGGINDQP